MYEKDWELTPDAANFLWPRLTGVDIPPYPLRMISSPQTIDERDQLAQELTSRYPVQHLPGQANGYLQDDTLLSAALGLLHTSEVRLTCTGGGPSTPVADGLLPAEPDFRAVVAMRGGQAVLAAQTPASPHLLLSLCPVDALEPRLIRCLPALTAGPDPRLTARTSDITGSRDMAHSNSALMIRALTTAPRHAEGIISIETQLDDPDMKPPARYLNWVNVIGRGGYLIHVGTEVTVWPAGTATLAAEFGKAVQRNSRARHHQGSNGLWLR